jgi:hypothetical protein
MKDITINGVLYLPATTLAKEFRYTTDYIGQLCRAKKVDAQLVGRSWYVNPLSLKSHKNNKTKKVIYSDITINKAVDLEVSESYTSSAPTEIGIRKVEITNDRAVKSLPFVHNNFVKRLTWQPVKYQEDEDELIPKVEKQSLKSHKVDVDLADSADIAIKSSSKPTKLVAEELPEVSLKGELKVTNIDDYFDDIIEDIKKEEVYEPEEISVAMEDEISNESELEEELEVIDEATYKITPNLHRKHAPKRPVSLIPKKSTRKQELAMVFETTKDSSSGSLSRFVFITSVTALLIISLMSVFVESTLLADADSYENKIKITKPSAAAITAILSEVSY